MGGKGAVCKPHACSMGNGWGEGYFPILYYLTASEIECGSLKTWNSLGVWVTQNGRCPSEPEQDGMIFLTHCSPSRLPKSLEKPTPVCTTLRGRWQQQQGTQRLSTRSHCRVDHDPSASGKLRNRVSWLESQRAAALRQEQAGDNECSSDECKGWGRRPESSRLILLLRTVHHWAPSIHSSLWH